MKKKLAVMIAVVLAMSALFATMGFAATTGGYKAINAWFGNIKIIANGKTLASDPQPFLYNNTTYVPIRLVSESLGQKVTWDQANTSVIISGGTTNSDDLNAQIAQKNATIASLQADNAVKAARIADLEAQLKAQQTSKNAASDFEDYLEDKYSTWKKIDFDFTAKGDSKALDLTIKVDLSDYSSKWNALDEDDIEDWLDDIYDYADDEYGATLSGEIYDTKSKDTLVSFKTSSSKLKVTFEKSSADPDALETYLSKNFSKNLGGWYDSSLTGMKATFDVTSNSSREKVYVTITIPDAYKDLTSKNVKEWISDVADATYDYFDKDYTLIGEVDSVSGTTLFTFDEDGLN